MVGEIVKIHMDYTSSTYYVKIFQIDHAGVWGEFMFDSRIKKTGKPILDKKSDTLKTAIGLFPWEKMLKMEKQTRVKF